MELFARLIFLDTTISLVFNTEGRLDESRKESVDGAKRELFEAMKQISKTGKGPDNQIPSMGCSIKWFE